MITSINFKNLGTVNKNQVVIYTDNGTFNLYFSYQTLIGIEYNWRKDDKHWHIKCVHQNDWSTTTGKLLNELEPDKKNRKSDELFNKEVSEMFTKIND